MEEIKRVFAAVRSRGELLEELKAAESRLEDARKEIDQLVAERDEVAWKMEKLCIEKTQEEIREVQKRIEQLSLLNAEVADVEDILRLVDSGMEETTVLRKLMLFVDSCISEGREGDAHAAVVHLGVPRVEIGAGVSGHGYIVVKTVLERLLGLQELSSEMHVSLQKYVKGVLLGAFSHMDCRMFEILDLRDAIYLLFSMEDTSAGVTCDSGRRLTAATVCSRYPMLADILCSALKKRITSLVQSGMFSHVSVVSLLGSLAGTASAVKEPKSWVLDTLLRETVRMSKLDETWDLEEQCPGGRHGPHLASIGAIWRLHCKICESGSERAARAGEMSGKAVQRSIHKRHAASSARELMPLFNSILHIEEGVGKLGAMKWISGAKEDVFTRIFDATAILPENVGENIESARLSIKTSVCSFMDDAAAFLDEKRLGLFVATFFDRSFSNFIEHVYSQDFISRENATFLAAVAEYMMSQCLVPRKELANHRKLLVLGKVLRGDCKKASRDLRRTVSAIELEGLANSMPWNAELQTLKEAST